MKRVLLFFAVSILTLIASFVSAETISTYLGDIDVTAGIAAYDPTNVGTLLNTTDMGNLGYGTSWHGPSFPAETAAVQSAGSTLDHKWVQGAHNEIIWILNKSVDTVIAFPGNDHGPLPMENMEYKLWGSNDGQTWVVGTLAAIYHDGLDSDPNNQFLQDWYATEWHFNDNYLLFKTVGTPGVVTGWSDYDPEMDGIAGKASAPVPEPATMLLLGSGIAGFAAARRRKK